MADRNLRFRYEQSRPALKDAGLLLLRVFAGLALASAHGFGKLPPSEGFIAGAAEMGFPLPVFFAWAAALAESLGGVLLALGLFTRPAALFILINMAVASFIRQAGDPFLERELSLLYGAVAILFLLARSGRFGLDALLRQRAPEADGAPADNTLTTPAVQ
jgi:putative oxidoreductase